MPRPHTKFAILILAGVISFLVGISTGSSKIGLNEILGVISGVEKEYVANILDFRLRRTLLSILVGVALSSSGCAMQSLFRNPLADPYIIGVSSGASVGAAIAILTGHGSSINIMAAAFISAIITVFVVYNLGKDSTYSLLLAGVAMATFLSGVTSLLIYISGQSLHQVLFWIMGGFWNANWFKVKIAFVGSLIGVAIILYNSWRLNALLLGEEHALSVGINIERLKREIIAATAFLTAIAVSVSGVIGFVGLIIPHTMRLLFGEDNRVIVPTSILFAFTFMPAVDTVARIAVPGELPVGVITSLLGAPFFIYLLRRKRYETKGQ
ncbi:iron chelate uptake ABC transporter family permease subunit [Geoglobus acetivorans]|uniref:Iron chelate uptake ABC transporter family permease subunit n=1 Tax=Geoglobus acetivorans TaxID=565033 RepID=A0ABZ3H3E1_GEOAI|nr:iron chelate uptake ABC transporter family permease subunit [Geoglobus acetivorans]